MCDQARQMRWLSRKPAHVACSATSSMLLISQASGTPQKQIPISSKIFRNFSSWPLTIYTDSGVPLNCVNAYSAIQLIGSVHVSGIDCYGLVVNCLETRCNNTSNTHSASVARAGIAADDHSFNAVPVDKEPWY